jgi:hypothetical protein
MSFVPLLWNRDILKHTFPHPTLFVSGHHSC